jgi:hypothetical protein
MRFLILMLLLAIPALAQQPASIVGRACGPPKESFSVELNPADHQPPAAPPGKALVYFVQDLGGKPFGTTTLLSSVTEIGIDGVWVGADQDNSWFSVSVDPGVHHVCAHAQSRLFNQVTELAHFTAEADRVYYFRIRNFMWQSRRLDFSPVDSDQALYMIGSSDRSAAQLKK